MAWNPKDDIYKLYGQTPDQELLAWEEWVQIRRDEVVKLAINLTRPPIDLVMHRLELKREDKERKKALEDAQTSLKPVIEDSLWAKSKRLHQPCDCAPVYEVHETASARREPNMIDHIQVSDYVKKTELGIFGKPERMPCTKLNADYVKYREKREKKFQNAIQKIDPFRSDISELVVIGRRPKTPPKKIPPLPEIKILQPPEPCHDALSGVYAIRINDTVVYKNIPDQSLPCLKKMQRENWHEFCYNWNYYFNVPEKKVGRSSLYLKNLGTVTLRYCWKKNRKMIPFIPEDIYEQKFFFYKNEDVLSPGQEKTLYFTFVSDKAGIYSESWELCLMNICLFDSLADKFVVHLVGDALENMKKMTKKIEKLQNRIDRKASEKFMTKLLNEIIVTATSVEHQIYPYKYLFVEADLFELRNPICFYHQTEVQKMKDLYKEMTGMTWDLTIGSWREAMMQKEYDERMMYFDLLKASHSVLLRPWRELDDVLEEKHRAVKLLFGQLLDKFSFEHDRIAEWNGVELENAGDRACPTVHPIIKDALTPHVVQNIFCIRMNIHVAEFIETIAGVISSIDMNRRIQFDFCQL